METVASYTNNQEDGFLRIWKQRILPCSPYCFLLSVRPLAPPSKVSQLSKLTFGSAPNLHLRQLNQHISEDTFEAHVVLLCQVLVPGQL